MGKTTGFIEYPRAEHHSEPVAERLKHWREFAKPEEPKVLTDQAARCMDCGVPFCHTGCPVNNIIPEWNDLVYHGQFREAIEVLHSTNNFPEITGRICPAPCEESCTLKLDDAPVTIKDIEYAISERAFQEGWVVPETVRARTGKRIAIVGSGPAGLAAAQQLARVGHLVTVFEKSAQPGGLLRYGIPDFKLEKRVVERRVAQMRAEGVEFRTGIHVGATLPAGDLLRDFDAVILAAGSEKPRDLPVPGRELDGVHFAMEFLTQQNKRNGGEKVDSREISAKGKHVIVMGGGDTGSDCIGTANRQGAKSITQIEIMPKPPVRENREVVWPLWPQRLRTSSSQEEGCERVWGVTAARLEGKGGSVTTMHATAVDAKFQPIAGSEFAQPAELVLLAMGFVHPVHDGLLVQLGVEKDGRGNVKASVQDYRSSIDKVFACGDARRGQSLVVWAIREGRQAARAVDEFLMGASDLPR
jgi:glutamate synthase (NADPH/NADH) small chain